MNLFVNLLQESFSLFKAGNAEECLQKLQEAKAAYSPDGENKNLSLEDLLQFEGGVYYQMQKFEEALQSFEAALKENPKSSLTCFHLGKTLIHLDNGEAAKTMLEYAVHYDPANTAAAELLAELNKEVIDETDEPAEKQVLAEALHYFESKEYKKSLSILTDVENEYKELLASVYNFKGFNFLALNQITNAKQSFEQAKLVNPNSSQAYAGLGEVFYLQNNDSEASEMYAKALAINPENQFAIAGQKKTGGVVQKPGVMQDTTIKEIENDIALAFKAYSDKKYDEGLKILELPESRLRQIDNIDVELFSRMLNFKGFLYLGKQDKENARAAFEEALKINPQSSQSATGLGEVFFMENNLSAAKQMFEWGVKLNADNNFAVACLEKVNKLLSV